jgi:hypothetical protein
MPSQRNKHGLSRDIPAPTKRAIRQECGYGCVVCASAIYQYEHINPEWHEALDHRVSAIALLCGSCHEHVTRGFWTKDKIRAARLHPRAVRVGAASWRLEDADGTKPFAVSLGGSIYIQPRTVLRLFGEDLLSICAPEAPLAPPRISGKFFDRNGKLTVELEDNECRLLIGNWDVIAKGGRIEVRSGASNIALVLSFRSPNHVAVQRLNAVRHGVHISASSRGVWIGKDVKRGIGFRGKVVEPDCAIDVRRAA